MHQSWARGLPRELRAPTFSGRLWLPNYIDGTAPCGANLVDRRATRLYIYVPQIVNRYQANGMRPHHHAVFVGELFSSQTC
jgi:hypothetical protein